MRKGFGLSASLAAVLALVLAACDGGGAPGTSRTLKGGTATVNMGAAPDSLDPQSGYTTEAAEADWLVYTGLLTYTHANGRAGTQLIPGLAEALPQISTDGLIYTFTLRPGLTYSNGQPVKASDFPYTVERGVKMNWGGKTFFTEYIEGAADYDSGNADSIRGITADDATGKITIQLLKPYGAFVNVVAFPAAGFVPSGTPITDMHNTPPPGVGSYTITDVVPNQSFTLEKTTHFDIPGIPRGHLQTVNVRIQPDTLTAAEQVLDNRADNFDAADSVPPALVGQIQSRAGDRFAKQTTALTYYFFLNTTIPPFNNPLAREAVNYAIDRRVLARLASGFLSTGCYLLPPDVPGHPTSPCPYGDPDASPDVNKAKSLVRQAGLEGSPVMVWSPDSTSREEQVGYYTGVLKEIGFNVTSRVVQSSLYFNTVGSASTNPQTGFADWQQNFPNPSDFYALLDGTAIQPVKNQNLAKVNDPQIQTSLVRLNPIPSTQLSSVASDWQRLDQHTAKQSYEAVYGYLQVPKFMSNRIDFKSAIFHPLYFNDWSSWRLER